ncbi:MAG: hypothetical protein QS748_13690 [Candidatus Endonucleobacter bathymodioli]|nr:hypothetical protein [Candidatus Endonucleobacter bathymodioli]
MLVTDISELIFALLNFTMNSESNWMITFPAIFALINFKYKNKNRTRTNAAALGLLMSAHSSIYTYKFITGYNNKIELCQLPDWMTKIKHIPKYTYVDPLTHKKTNTSTSLLTPTEWITPDKLTCKNLVDLDKAFKSVHSSESEIRILEICGLIDNADFSLMCYSNNWEKYQFNIDLAGNQSKRCDSHDLCVSAKALIGRFNSQNIAGYEVCCIENHGECSLPDSYFDDEINRTDSFKLKLGDLKDTKYNMIRYIPYTDKSESYWKVVVEKFSGGKSVMLDNITGDGIYAVKNTRTQLFECIICVANKKISITPIENSL